MATTGDENLRLFATALLTPPYAGGPACQQLRVAKLFFVSSS